MNHRGRPSPKLNHVHRRVQAEPSRLEQIEGALHRLSKKVGKLNKAYKDLKANYENELAALQEAHTSLAAELAELKKHGATLETRSAERVIEEGTR